MCRLKSLVIKYVRRPNDDDDADDFYSLSPIRYLPLCLPCLSACLPACLPLFKSSWGSAGWRCRVKAPLNYSTTISIVSGACCNIAGAETALSNWFSEGWSKGVRPLTAIPLLLSRKAIQMNRKLYLLDRLNDPWLNYSETSWNFTFFNIIIK